MQSSELFLIANADTIAVFFLKSTLNYACIYAPYFLYHASAAFSAIVLRCAAVRDFALAFHLSSRPSLLHVNTLIL